LSQDKIDRERKEILRRIFCSHERERKETGSYDEEKAYSGQGVQRKRAGANPNSQVERQ